MWPAPATAAPAVLFSLLSTHTLLMRNHLWPLSMLLLIACAATPADDAVARADADRDGAARDRAEALARARQDSINRAQPGYIVDSILPIAEEMRRFRAAVGGDPAIALRGGSGSRGGLVARFAESLASGDSAALRRLAVSPREFIDLVYPESPNTRPPYQQAPGLLWRQIQLPSGSGLRRLLERHGGRPFRVETLRCPSPPEVQGSNRLHVGCTVRFVAGADASREGRLFGTIVERQGHFKFVSFSNMY